MTCIAAKLVYLGRKEGIFTAGIIAAQNFAAWNFLRMESLPHGIFAAWKSRRKLRKLLYSKYNKTHGKYLDITGFLKRRT